MARSGISGWLSYLSGLTETTRGRQSVMLQRVRCRASQAPNQPRGCIFKVDGTIHAVLRHRFNNHGAEPAPLRRRHGRPLVLRPAHGEGITGDPPADIHTTSVSRERPIFPGVGGEFVERDPDGLGGGRVQAKLGAMHGDTRTNEVGEMRELSVNQVLDINSLPLVPDHQVLIGRKRLDTLSEAPDKVFRLTSRGLAGDCVYETEHILGAMIDLAHQETLPLLAVLAFRNVLHDADDACGPWLRPSPVEVSKPMRLHPPNLAGSPLNPILMRWALRIG